MHEEEARAVGQHMTVQRRDDDAVVAQRPDHGIDLTPDQHEIAGDRRLASTRRLEVDRRRQAHGWRDVDPVHGDPLRPRHAHLVHATVHLPVVAEGSPDLRGVDTEASGRRRRGGRAQRRGGEDEGGANRRREPRRRAAPRDVHIHDARGLMQEVVVQRGLLDPTVLELAEDGADLVLEQHEVAHQHGLAVSHLLERDPGAKRQGRLDCHPSGGDVQVTARHPDLVGPIRL